MTIYVDPIRTFPVSMIKPAARKHGDQWCHMVTDGDDDEMHRFAESIGLRRSMFQPHRFFSHYDLTPALREKAIRAGAVEVTSLAYLARQIGKV